MAQTTFRGKFTHYLMMLLVAIGMLAVPIITSSPAGAGHGATLGGSNFEITGAGEANLKVDTAGHLDWNVVTEQFKTDEPSGSNDDSMVQGTWEDTEPPKIGVGSIPPNKSDLKRFGLYLEDNQFLHLYWSRVQDPKGTTNMDFEFNQSDTTSTNGVTPERTAGDLLIEYKLSKGGTVPQFFLYKWETADATKCVANSKVPCWGHQQELTGSLAAGSVNTQAIPAGDSKIGALDPFTFGEGTIDLDVFFGTATTCVTFGSAYLKSRSSDSFNAALKDFIAPLTTTISNCGSIQITKTDNSTPANALAGAKFTLWNDLDPAATFNPSPGGLDTKVSPEKSCTTGITGVCTISNVLQGDYWVVEEIVPTGYTGANPQQVTVTTSTTPVQLTFVNQPNAASLKIKKVDDDGNPLQGVAFSLFRDDSAPFGDDGATSKSASDTDTNLGCTTDATGVCTISNILQQGDFWIVEDAAPSGYTAAADRFVNDLTFGEDRDLTGTAFVNPRQHKVIVIVCHQGTNTLAPSDYDDTDAGTAQKTSISTSAATTAGLSESALCGLDGFSGKAHGPESYSVDVGSDAHS